MNDRIYLIRDRAKNTRLFKASEIIANAEKQKSEGYKPSYCYNFGNGEYSNPGYLVVSLWYGCIVAAEIVPGKWHIMQGWQSDFVVG